MGRADRIRKHRPPRRQDAPLACFDRAVHALQSGNRAAAIVLLHQTILDDPCHVSAHFNLATALREQSKLAEAIDAYRQVLVLDPRHKGALANLGETLRRSGRLLEALASCDKAIAIDAGLADAYLIRGVTYHDRGDIEAAVADLNAAIARAPNTPNAYKILGTILKAADRKEDALAAFQAASIVKPDDAEVFRFIGDLCDVLGRLSEGFVAYRKAIELDQYDAFAYANLAGLLCRTKLLDVALSVADIAIKLAPNMTGAHFNRAIALEKLDRLEESLLSYAEALRCEPGSGRALISICRLRSQICDWDRLAASEGLARTLTYKKGNPTSPFAILPMTSSLADILACNRVWSKTIERVSPPLAPYLPRPHDRRHERLRIGYLSADFHMHATAALIAEVFELHEKARFETWGYSIGAHDDGEMRRRLVRALDHFDDLTDLSHDDAAARIRRDEIDILVDLKGYTFQSRPEILARRPAPIQVNYLGYPSTMGAGFIDYIIGDRVVTPMEHAPYYTEKIVQLPHSYQPNDRKRPISPEPPTRGECGLPEGAFVFCSFNSSYKITPRVFDIWIRLLRDVPRSVLWLYEANVEASSNLRREAAARGIDPARLVFAPKLPVAAHLARMQLGDLFLDTSPVGAHTTASEALWVGLPIVTCLGEGFAARVCASLLDAIGLPELIASTREAYEAIARRLARQPDELRALRARLKANIASAPLFDTPRYTRDLENAFARMAAIRDAGEAPHSFAVRGFDAGL